QGHPVVLAGLRIGRDAAGVVVPNHHDQPGTGDDQQGPQSPPAAAECGGVVTGDAAEGSDNVADVRRIQRSVPGGAALRGGNRGHRVLAIGSWVVAVGRSTRPSGGPPTPGPPRGPLGGTSHRWLPTL